MLYRVSEVNAFHFTYLNKRTRRQLLGVDDQFRAIPKGQSETKENDAPQVSLKNSYDHALFLSPVLSFHKVSVISVQISHFNFISNHGVIANFLEILENEVTPFSFFFLPAKGCYCSDG